MIAVQMILNNIVNSIPKEDIMQKFTVYLICILALLIFMLPVIASDDQNATQSTKVLRVGFENTKPINNLDVYGSKALYNAEANSNVTQVFNASQRLGIPGTIRYNTSIYKPIYNVSEYSRAKPTYQVPSSLSSRPVYNIAAYPKIKVPNSIP